MILDEQPNITSAHSQNINEIIRWWELRRIYFNLIVGLIGSPILGLGYLMRGRNHIDLDELLIGAFIYAVILNVLYSVGTVSSALIQKYSPQTPFYYYAPVLYFVGLIASVLVTGTIALLSFIAMTF